MENYCIFANSFQGKRRYFINTNQIINGKTVRNRFHYDSRFI
jgi:hypothetical protein